MVVARRFAKTRIFLPFRNARATRATLEFVGVMTRVLSECRIGRRPFNEAMTYVRGWLGNRCAWAVRC
jgi:hypothetical protein